MSTANAVMTLLRAAVASFALSPALLGQAIHPQNPTIVWTLNASNDTTMALPLGLAADSSSGVVYVADLWRPGIVVLDASSGRAIRAMGRKGDGPGEFRSPQYVTLSPSGRLLAVYDVGRNSVDFLSREGQELKRMFVGSYPYLKGFVVGDDTTRVVLSGGQVSPGHGVSGIKWMQGKMTRTMGPTPASTPALSARDDLDVRLYLAGGPLILSGDSAFMADGTSGDVWVVTPDSSRKVADGWGTPADIAHHVLRPGPGGAHIISFGFARAMYIGTLPGHRFLVARSDQENRTVTFYVEAPGHPAREISTWHLGASTLVRYNDDSWILTFHGDPSGWIVSRVRMPISTN